MGMIGDTVSYRYVCRLGLEDKEALSSYPVS